MKVLRCDINDDPVVGEVASQGYDSPTIVTLVVQLQPYELQAIGQEVRRAETNKMGRRRELIRDVATGRKIVKVELMPVDGWAE